MTRRKLTVSVHPDVTVAVTSAAEVAHPRETGGILLGWWEDGRVIVREAVEVPDPEATQNTWCREHDRAQAALTATLAEREHPWLGYVGDWHTHPIPCAASPQDLTSIRRASRQYPDPLVLLVRRADGELDVLAAKHGRTRAIHLEEPTIGTTS